METTLRPWRKTDAEALALLANDEAVAANLRNTFPHPYCKADAQLFLSIAEKVDPGEGLLLAIEADGTLAGGISLEAKKDVNQKCAELGYWLGRAFWGKGIATEAVRQITARGFAEYGLVRIYAEVFETNAASAQVLEKNGFVFEGRLRKNIYKHGKVMDSLLYAIVTE